MVTRDGSVAAAPGAAGAVTDPEQASMPIGDIPGPASAPVLALISRLPLEDV